jgi:cell division protein FtsB
VRGKGQIRSDRTTQALALSGLLGMAAWALIGPSGMLSWSENNRLLSEREAEVGRLTVERTELKNRVALLDPSHADPDLTGELLRSNLNVVHPDEMVLMVD